MKPAFNFGVKMIVRPELGQIVVGARPRICTGLAATVLSVVVAYRHAACAAAVVPARVTAHLRFICRRGLSFDDVLSWILGGQR